MSRPPIDPIRDREVLLDQPKRRAIAKTCRRRPSSVAEIERALGCRGLQKTVGKLVEWKVLVPVGVTTRGSPRYTLDKSWSDELDTAIRRNSSTVAGDQRLVLLARSNLSDAARCLAREHAHELAWVGILGEREGLVLAIDSSDTKSRISEMQQSLREAGLDCELKTIGLSATGDEVAPFLRGFGSGSNSRGAS
jgi:hypothetical protein